MEIRSSRSDHLETPESWVDIPELISSRCGPKVPAVLGILAGVARRYPAGRVEKRAS